MNSSQADFNLKHTMSRTVWDYLFNGSLQYNFTIELQCNHYVNQWTKQMSHTNSFLWKLKEITISKILGGYIEISNIFIDVLGQ